MGVSHAFAAAALCRVEFPPTLPKAPVPGFYTIQGFLALAVEGRKHEELMTSDKTAPIKQFSLTWSTDSLG